MCSGIRKKGVGLERKSWATKHECVMTLYRSRSHYKNNTIRLAIVSFFILVGFDFELAKQFFFLPWILLGVSILKVVYDFLTPKLVDLGDASIKLYKFMIHDVVEVSAIHKAHLRHKGKSVLFTRRENYSVFLNSLSKPDYESFVNHLKDHGVVVHEIEGPFDKIYEAFYE